LSLKHLLAFSIKYCISPNFFLIVHAPFTLHPLLCLGEYIVSTKDQWLMTMSFNKLCDYLDKELHQKHIQDKCTTFVERKKRNVSNTHFNTHFSTHFLWLVKIHMRPTKSCGSYIHLVGLMWILTNQRECVLKCVLLAFLKKKRSILENTYIRHLILYKPIAVIIDTHSKCKELLSEVNVTRDKSHSCFLLVRCESSLEFLH